MRYLTKGRKGHNKSFGSFIPKKQKGLLPRLKEMGKVEDYNPGSFTLEKLREVFAEQFYSSYPDNSRAIKIYISGTVEECKKTLKIFDDALRAEATKFLR